MEEKEKIVLEQSNNENVNNDSKGFSITDSNTKKKKGLFVILAVVILAFVGIGIFILFKDGKKEDNSLEDKNNGVEVENDNSDEKEEEKKETETQEDENDSNTDVDMTETIELDGYTIVSKYVESDENDIDQYMYVYKDDKLIKEIPNAFFIEKVEVKDNVLYRVSVEIARGGVIADTTKILNDKFEVILETSELPKKNDYMNDSWFDPMFLDEYIVVFIRNETGNVIYFYDLSGNLVDTNDEAGIIDVTFDYYLVQEGTKYNLKDLEGNFVVTMFDTNNAEYKNYELTSLLYMYTPFVAINKDDDRIGIYVNDTSKEDEDNEFPDYVIYYSPKTGKVTKEEFKE